MTDGRNRAGVFLWGGLALLTGLPFLAAGFSASLLTGRLERGLPLTAVILFAVWYLSGFHGAGVAAVCAGTAVLCASRGFSAMKTILWTGGLTLAAGWLLSLGFPGFMNVTEADLAPLRDIYLSSGMDEGMVDRVFALIVHFAPGLGAVQLAGGAAASVLLFRSLPRTARTFPELSVPVRFRMHWGVAWIPILCLLAIVLDRSSPLPEWILRAAGNLLLFMAVPYSVEGLQTAVHWARRIPGMIMLLVIAGLFATPVVAAAILLVGILDTWFDYRKRIDNERNSDEDSADKDG